MLYGECGSPEHLIIGFDQAKRSALVNMVHDGSIYIYIYMYMDQGPEYLCTN